MKLFSQVSSRGRSVVVPHSRSCSSTRLIIGPRATIQVATAAAIAASHCGPSSIPAARSRVQYAANPGAATSAGSWAKHQQLGNGASR